MKIKQKNALAAVKKDGLALQYVETQTEEICLAAVKHHAYAIQYVKNQTEEMCLIAVKDNYYFLEDIKNQTDKICLAAVNNDSRALIYVKNQTDEICLAAVQKNGFSLLNVKDKTEEICLAAVKQNPWVLTIIEKQTPEMCLIAVKNNGLVLKYIKNPTKEIRQSAIFPSVTEKVYPIDEEGYLIDMNTWDCSFAENCAKEEGLELSSEHWVIICLLRDFYDEYQIISSVRVLAKRFGEFTGKQKVTSKYLYSLFPYGPTKQAAKYAGLPCFRGCGFI